MRQNQRDQNARGRLAAMFSALALVLLGAGTSAAEEGMWTFDNFPAARMRGEMDWAPDQPWLDRVMTATARLPGCSGAVVSGQGLVLTNHHCIIACVQALSSAEADYLADGFFARARREERRCPGANIDVLIAISDVTAHIDAATTEAPQQAFAAARDVEIRRIEAGCAGEAIHCEVVTLYEGGRYALYRYHRYEDVRLVLAPEHAMAAFGGEADNFNFPRYCIDFAFLRLYERDAPAQTPHYLSLRLAAPDADEIVLAAGNPGATARSRTAAELAFERDVNLPWRLSMLNDQRARLAAYARLGATQARSASSALQNVDNAYQALAGRRAALMDTAGMARVEARDSDLQTRVRRNRAATREVGDAWGEIARAEAAYRGFFLPHQLLEPRAGEGSVLFFWARDIVRAAAEREKPDAERLGRYTDARLPAILYTMRGERTIDAALEELNLGFWLSKLREHLGTNPIVRGMLASRSADELAAELAGSRLAEASYRLQLWDGGAASVAASDDPMIVLARAIDADARGLQARYVNDVQAPIARARERIARARFRAFGDARYPEASFTPRLSYGRVRGWNDNQGAAIAPLTTIGGLLQRAGDVSPFALSSLWRGAEARLAPDAILNLVSSNDTIAGSSGSALIDQEGRVVGAVFDGNLASLAGEYYYDGAANRTISVSSMAIGVALRDVYGMDALASELHWQ